MLGAVDVHRVLLEREIPHEIIRLPRAVMAAAELPELLAVPASSCVAVSVYVCCSAQASLSRQSVSGQSVSGQSVSGQSVSGQRLGGLVALLLTVDARPDLTALRRASAMSAVRPATAVEVNAATDHAASLVCPANIPAGLSVLADIALAGSPSLYCPTGESGTVLRIAGAALLEHTGAWVGVFTVPAGVDRTPAHDQAQVLVDHALL